MNQRTKSELSYIKNFHVRRLITNPIAIFFDKLLSYLNETKQTETGITIASNNGQAKNGFSFSSNGITYYGIKDNKNMVSVFCLYSIDSDKALEQLIERVSTFLSTENLYLVDWIQRKTIDEKTVKDYFVPKESK